MTTYGAANDDKVVKLTTFCFQWCKTVASPLIMQWIYHILALTHEHVSQAWRSHSYFCIQHQKHAYLADGTMLLRVLHYLNQCCLSSIIWYHQGPMGQFLSIFHQSHTWIHWTYTDHQCRSNGSKVFHISSEPHKIWCWLAVWRPTCLYLLLPWLVNDMTTLVTWMSHQ